METVESVSKWAEETFGECTPEAALNRAMQEMEELYELVNHGNPDLITQYDVVKEAADVCITLYRYIYLVDPEAIEKKMAVNRKRQWKLDGKGCAQHISAETTTPQPRPETQ